MEPDDVDASEHEEEDADLANAEDWEDDPAEDDVGGAEGADGDGAAGTAAGADEGGDAATESEEETADEELANAFEEVDEELANAFKEEEAADDETREDTQQEMQTDDQQQQTQEQQQQPEEQQRPETEADIREKVMQALTDEQLNRYEAFRRASLAKPRMKKLMASILKTAGASDRAVLAMCGIAKLYVGEIVETARVIAGREKHDGPLLPKHVHAAYQALRDKGKVPLRHSTKRLFR